MKQINSYTISAKLDNIEDPIVKDPNYKIVDDQKAEFILENTRTIIDFDNEIKSIAKHEEVFTRPRLSYVMNNVYIPKFKVKSFSSFIYSGESSENYNNYSLCVNKNTLFADKNRSRDSVILGIESSFDDSAASLVNSWGEIKANTQIQMWEQWRDLDGIEP